MFEVFGGFRRHRAQFSIEEKNALISLSMVAGNKPGRKGFSPIVHILMHDIWTFCSRLVLVFLTNPFYGS